MSVTLQSLVLPGLEHGAPQEIYARTNDKVRVYLESRTMCFEEGGRASFDTFFNGLTVQPWRHSCGVDEMSLRLHGAGDFILRFGLHRIGYGHRWLAEMIVTLDAQMPQQFPLAFWPALTDGMLYVCLEALGRGALQAGGFETAMQPRRAVRLGVVITHFNRKAALLPALRRILAALPAPQAGRAPEIQLVIVDNSRDVTAQEAAGAILIQNRNLGGAGGFMRGLLYLQDHGFSHCLFMDDDASCEIESIHRAYALQRFLIPGDTAIAGSLLRETEPYRLFEKGAQFELLCRPLKSGLDMRHVHDLLLAERMDEAADYGGWWFFAFAIARVRHYAFPYFVRGDDIQFSTLNRFEILTMNGIACWAEDFSFKQGPLQVYLDVRYHILQNLCVAGTSLAAVLRMLIRFFLYAACSYNYASARAVTLAIADVLQGPAFWTQDMELAAKRAEVQGFAAAEKMLPLDRTQTRRLTRHTPTESAWRRALRMLTLNGFLLPGFMLKRGTVFQHKGFNGSLRNVFRFQRVLYEHEPSGTGYIARHDKRRFFAASAAFAATLLRFALRGAALRRQYARSLPQLTSEAFWRDVYAAAAPVRAPACAPAAAMAAAPAE